MLVPYKCLKVIILRKQSEAITMYTPQQLGERLKDLRIFKGFKQIEGKRLTGLTLK